MDEDRNRTHQNRTDGTDRLNQRLTRGVVPRREESHKIVHESSIMIEHSRYCNYAKRSLLLHVPVRELLPRGPARLRFRTVRAREGGHTLSNTLEDPMKEEGSGPICMVSMLRKPQAAATVGS